MKRYLSRPAFTLIELIIACSLLTLIISFSLPKQSFFTKKLVRSELKTLRTTMQYLQQKAIASNRTNRLTLSPATNSYAYTQHDRCVIHALPSAVCFDTITFAKNRILFHPNGTISPGTVHLIDRDKTTRRTLTCAVSHASFLRMY